MGSLYKTYTINTFDEYKRFSKILFMNKKNTVIICLVSVFLIFAGIVLNNWFFIAFAFLYPALVTLMHNLRVKNIFKTNKALKDVTVDFEFYDTFFTTSFENGTTNLEYTKIYKIIETKTNFYLMIANNQGYVLCKNNFPDGLEDFLRNLKNSL